MESVAHDLMLRLALPVLGQGSGAATQHRSAAPFDPLNRLGVLPTGRKSLYLAAWVLAG